VCRACDARARGIFRHGGENLSGSRVKNARMHRRVRP
jgi:hypothetical protein